jgi:hypothetical protein
MTTPNEREARELLAQHCECGGTMQYTKTDDCIRAIIAALTREQREAQPEAPGAMCSPGEPAPPPSTPAQHYLAKHNGCASQDWQDGFNVCAQTTPPAPVDVRKQLLRMRNRLDARRNDVAGGIEGSWHHWQYQTYTDLIEEIDGALLSGQQEKVAATCGNTGMDFSSGSKGLNSGTLDDQQAGVVIDDAAVQRAINACCTSGAYFAPETDDEWRAALQAALGGGGRG